MNHESTVAEGQTMKNWAKITICTKCS